MSARVGARPALVAASCAAALLALSCSGSGSSEGDAPFAATLDELVPRLLDEYGVPGAAIALIEDGEVAWSGGYGLADEATGEPVTSETVFQVASLSKAVTAFGVMGLVDEGLLDLDAPVETYLTRWELPASEHDADGVTLRRILSHTAGLSLSGYPGFEPDAELPSLEASLSGDTNGPGDVRVIGEPGAQYSYSGGGYTLAQLVIEEVTGETFALSLNDRVLSPLGMAGSTFDGGGALAVAKAYDVAGEELPNYLFAAQAAAGLYATAADYARFVAALIGSPPGGGIVSPESVETMLAPADSTIGTYGLGIALATVDRGGRFITHSGANRGWRSYFAGLPELGDGIVILTNSDLADPSNAPETLRTDIVCVWLRSTAGDELPGCDWPRLAPEATP